MFAGNCGEPPGGVRKAQGRQRMQRELGKIGREDEEWMAERDKKGAALIGSAAPS
jgi:hypothetical protein